MSWQVFCDKLRYYKGLAKCKWVRDPQVLSSNDEALCNELQTQAELKNTKEQLQSHQFTINDLSNQLRTATTFLITLALNQFPSSS